MCSNHIAATKFTTDVKVEVTLMSVVFLSELTSIRSISRWIARLSGASRIDCSHFTMVSEVYSSINIRSKTLPSYERLLRFNGSDLLVAGSASGKR